VCEEEEEIEQFENGEKLDDVVGEEQQRGEKEERLLWMSLVLFFLQLAIGLFRVKIPDLELKKTRSDNGKL